MGTDIHVYIEQKNPNGEWEFCGLYDRYTVNGDTVVEPGVTYCNRNYNLFSLLGEQWRGEYEVIVPMHGKPNDLSDEVYRMTLDEDTGEPSSYYFEYNWLTISELDMVMDTLHKLRKLSKRDKRIYNTFRDFYAVVSNAMFQSARHISGRDNTRIVYWFDN